VKSKKNKKSNVCKKKSVKGKRLSKLKQLLSAPKAVGKINLDPKKQEVKSDKPVSEEKPVLKVEEKPVVSEQKPVEQKPVEVVNKEEVSEQSVPVKEEVVKPVKEVEEKSESALDEAGEVKIETQYQKLSGATFTGQKIDLSQFEKPKKKKEDPKKDIKKPGAPQAQNAGGANAANNKNKRKRIIKPGGPGAPGTPGANNAAGGPKREFVKGGGSAGGFNKGKKPIIQKVEPSEEDVKNQIKETLERLQGKGNKSKSAKYRRDKRDSHRQRVDDELQAQQDLESKIFKSNRICYCR
jgi:translation initiation factor IF-2